MADDGSGIALVPAWYGGVTPLVSTNLPILDANGAIVGTSDQGLPGGIQNVNFSASINRDQVLDVRATSPVQWVTTYPIDLRMDLETHVLAHVNAQVLPGDAGYNASTFKHEMRNLRDL